MPSVIHGAQPQPGEVARDQQPVYIRESSLDTLFHIQQMYFDYRDMVLADNGEGTPPTSPDSIYEFDPQQPSVLRLKHASSEQSPAESVEKALKEMALCVSRSNSPDRETRYMAARQFRLQSAIVIDVTAATLRRFQRFCYDSPNGYEANGSAELVLELWWTMWRIRLVFGVMPTFIRVGCAPAMIHFAARVNRLLRSSALNTKAN